MCGIFQKSLFGLLVGTFRILSGGRVEDSVKLTERIFCSFPDVKKSAAGAGCWSVWMMSQSEAVSESAGDVSGI